MKLFLLLASLTLAVLTAFAGEPDYRSFFAHPNVRVRVQIDHSSSKTIPFRNHSVPSDPSETPDFHSGFSTTGLRPDNPEVEWQFVRKTDWGDLYLCAIKRKGVLQKAIPALYVGSPLVVYDEDAIRVTLEPIPVEDTQS